MDQMRKWLVNYERLRHSKRPTESWISSRYDIQGMHWQELQQLYLPELNMRWGPAVSALKKLWKSYKIAGRTRESRSDLAWKINQIQKAMGIEKSEFPELDGIETDDEESTDEAVTREEIELRHEENEENEEEDDDS
jgi:Ran GTPase-activating protein (RanGAP) involved in mRNA processing and transport